MRPIKISNLEKIVLVVIFAMLVVGFVLWKADPSVSQSLITGEDAPLSLFETYTREDGLVEWLTVLGLLLGFFVCCSRVFRLARNKSIWFSITCIGLGLLLFFAAGEEISWGQRIFSIKSSAFFTSNNTQKEMNFHNLKIGGVKLNKAIFSIGLSIAMGIYLVVLPLLYRSSRAIRSFADNWGIPVARFYQIISFAVLYGLTEIIRHEKRAELLEAGFAFLIFLIINYPENKRAFQKNY